MFPVYFLAIRNQQNDSIHYAVVNGQTGKVAIELPIDFKKYVSLSLLIALFFFIGMNAFLTIKPQGVLGFCIVASLISIFFSYSQLKRIEAKRTHRDDAGYMNTVDKMQKSKVVLKKPSILRASLWASIWGVFWSFIIVIFLNSVTTISEKNIPGILLGAFSIITFFIAKKKLKSQNEKRAKNVKLLGEEFVKEREEFYEESVKMKFHFLMKEIFALIISVIVLLSGTIEDSYFYTATVISLILVIVSFYDLVKEHNLLVSNKIPQLEKRGGDENE
jgi:cation transport ATPase